MTIAVPPPSSPEAAPRIRRGLAPSIASRPDMLCWAVVAMGLVYVWRIPVLFPGLLVPFRLGIVTTVVALLAWLSANDPMRRWNRFDKLKPMKLVFGLCLALLASVPLGIYPGRSFAFVRNTWIGLVIYLVLTVASVRSRADLERLMLAHIAGAGIFSVFAFRTVIGPSGRLSNLPSMDANDFAMLLVCTIPLAVYFMRTGAKMLMRVVIGVALVLFVIILVRSGSRGGFLGFVATLLYLLFRFKGIPVRVRVAAITVGLVTLSMAGTDKYWALMGTIRNPSEDYNFTEAGGRIAVWKRGIGYVRQHPVLGVGIENFNTAEGQSELNRARAKEGKGWISVAPHNSFVQIAVESGLLGFGLFLAVLWTSLRACSWRLSPTATPAERDEQAAARALAGSLVGYCVAGFFLSQAYSPYLYSLLGMIAGLVKLRSMQSAPALAKASSPRAARASRSQRVRLAPRGA
jgi:putative inorganic carbon (HCO3(-)) transporter